MFTMPMKVSSWVLLRFALAYCSKPWSSSFSCTRSLHMAQDTSNPHSLLPNLPAHNLVQVPPSPQGEEHRGAQRDRAGMNGIRNGSLGEDRNSQLAKRLKTELPLGRIEKAWEHWRSLGEPKFIVAPMVDQSELPFRMLCRKYGATAAYTPMLHARLFAEDPKYRSSEFTTCSEDRPLFVQFCANDPETLLAAARIVEPFCDYVDINLGCPQRIAKRGNYGAFLMDNLPLIRSLVHNLASNLKVPVSCKIRLFPNLEDTLSYARMLEEAGCSLLAVHGRTRDQKDSKSFRADWTAIKAVKEAVNIPVLANGNIQWLNDVYDCLRETAADGILSAESLLENPALFAGYQVADIETQAVFPDGILTQNSDILERELDQPALLLEYLGLCEKYPVPWRMIRGHVHRMLGNWFRIHTDLREQLNKESKLTLEFLQGIAQQLVARNTRIPLLQSSLPPHEISGHLHSSVLLDSPTACAGSFVVYDGQDFGAKTFTVAPSSVNSMVGTDALFPIHAKGYM